MTTRRVSPVFVFFRTERPPENGCDAEEGKQIRRLHAGQKTRGLAVRSHKVGGAICRHPLEDLVLFLQSAKFGYETEEASRAALRVRQ